MVLYCKRILIGFQSRGQCIYTDSITSQGHAVFKGKKVQKRWVDEIHKFKVRITDVAQMLLRMYYK